MRRHTLAGEPIRKMPLSLRATLATMLAPDVWRDTGVLILTRWKDEDEFTERIDHPLYWTAEQAAAIRAEGERVIALVEAGRHPFDGWLTDFRPDPRWEPSRLPPHWDLPDCGSIGA